MTYVKAGACGANRNGDLFASDIQTCGRIHQRAIGNGLRATLMSATMLAGAAALAAAMPQQAFAQHIIEDEDVVVPGDRPDPWNIGNSLTVGNFGDSTLTISDGAVVNSTSGFVAFRAGSTGAVTVTGAGSRWNNPGEIRIGGLGAGALTILDGGSVHSGIGYIAYEAGSSAVVTVNGAGSEWISTSTLMVGGSGSANMTISDGGLVQNVRGEIGVDTPAVSSSVLVTGAGSQWINTDALRIGLFGTGALTIADGGEVSATGVNIGMFAAGTGTLNFGAAAGDAAVAAGTLDTPTIAFGPGTGTIVFNHTSNDLELDADISGNGTVRILSGRTILAGNNTYTGDTFFDGGTIALGSDSALGTSTLTVTGATQLGRPTLTATGGPRTLDNDIVLARPGGEPFAAFLTIDATTHALTLNGDMSGLGFVRVNGGAGVTITGAISADLDLDLSDNSRLRAEGALFSSIFANSGSIIELGDGVSAFSTINADGDFTLQTAASESASLAGFINLMAPRVLTLTGGELVVNAEIFSSNAASINITGGNITLGGNNTFSGGLSVSGGSLTLAHANALPSGNALTLTNDGAVTANHALTLGGLNMSENSTLVLNQSTTIDSAGTHIMAGVLSGAGGLTFNGGGHFTLSGNNTYTGSTLLEGGTLTLGHSNALGGSTLTTTGSVVDYADGVDIANSIVIDSDTTQFQVLTGSATQSGVISQDNGPRPFEKIGDGELILTAANTWTGETTVSAGTLTFDGGSVALAADQDFHVGRLNGDNGALNIINGGSVANRIGRIGDSSGATGTVTVAGAGSSWTNTGALTVGASGTGTLSIEAGGMVSNTSAAIAGAATSNGSAIVTGAGSIWTNSSELRIGSSGTGTLTIANGGVVNSNGGLVGAEAGSSGTVTISGTGSSWNNTGALRIGRFGAGTLTVSNGGSLTSVNAIVAAQAGSSGSATVTGTGSSWTTTNYLDVGDFDTGYLTIADGGTVNSGTGRLGYYPDGDGHVTVTGADSSWTMSGLFSVGRLGAGTLTIAGGGEVRNTTGYIGEQAGSTGAAAVTGSGSGWINSNLYVGNSGEGTLTLSEGGEVSADEVIIANNASSTGMLYIGSDGVAPSGAGILNTPSVTFGAGTGALVFNHTNCCGLFFDADISSDPLGQAFILHAEGLTHLTGNSAGFAGGVLVGGGALSVDGTLGSGGVELGVDGSGFLTGSGTVGGDVLVAGGGTLVGVSGSTLTITGDLGLTAGAQVIAALGAPGDGELFAVGGDLTLDGTLDVIDMGGFGPGLYGLFTYGGSLTDNGFAIGAAPGVLPGELQLQTSVAGEVNLVSNIGVDLLFWDGDDPANALNGVIDGGDGVWSANSFTFTDADGLVSGPSRPTPGFIVFSGAAGHVTADDSEGAIEIAGAQFAVDGYLIDGDGITLAGNGDGDAIFRVGNGTGAGAAFTATIGSDLSGDAALVKTDLGTLILTGTNSYTGGTEVRSGTLIGSTRSIIGDIANDGVVVFDQADDATLDQALSGNGLFRFTGGAEFTLGAGNSYASGTQVFGSQLVLIADDSAGTGAITLNNSNIAYGDGITVSNTLTFSGTNELQVRSGTATHAGLVTGGGDLGLTGAGTLIFAGNGSAFTGNTIITGNVLMNGVLGGTIEVADGGVLRGFGTLGSTRLLSGSTIAPGNSVGTLNIDGDLIFESGSVYEATALPNGQSDLIAVSGAVTINGGSVLVVGTDSGFAASISYTILSADGGITGEFDAIASNFAFLTPNLSLTGGTLTLQLERNILDFAQFAQTNNQRSVANAADSLGIGNPVWEALVLLEEAAAPLAFEALNGELHATHRQLVMDDTIHSRRAVTSRLAAARSEETGSAWISGHFGGAQMDARTGVSRASADTSGVMLGLDTPVHDTARIGVIAAFGESSFSLGGGHASGTSESRSLGVYGGGQFGGFGVSAGAIYGWHDLSTNRLVSFPGINEHVSASHSADTMQVFGEVSLAGPAGFEPFLTLAHVRLDTGSFAEAGGVSALALDGETRQMTQGTLGSRFSQDWQAGDTAIHLEGSLGWRRVFSGHRQFVSGNLSGAPVFFEGNGIDRDAAAIEAGIMIEPASRISLELGYAGEIGSNARNHGAEFRARWAF
ncbi:autotransporter domain-containing protein [Glycocaulis sp.]|uniref:autotransporter domain-containing protein n=1 Tax=Glycocaulis sp. TaxID=1969725 RepID=UPI003D1AFABB